MLAASATNPHYTLLQLLLARGASVNARDNRGRTPLLCLLEDACIHYVYTIDDEYKELNPPAYYQPREDILDLLLHKGADINAQYSRGNTALSWAKTTLAECETDGHRKQAQHVIDILLAAGAKQ